MDRRKFVKDLSIYSAGTAAAAQVVGAGGEAMAANAQPVVTIARGKDWSKLVGQALAPLGGMGAFVKKGQSVCVKPNISFDTGPDYATNTHPEIVKAIVQQCLDAGASKVVVFDYTLRSKRRCYENSGVKAALDAIDDKRLKLAHAEERQFVEKKIKGAQRFKSWKFNKMALDADVYINVPIAKHHSQTKLTLGLKNIIGIIGGRRAKIHTDLHRGIAALNTVVTPALTVIDGTRILLRHGPTGGNLEDVEVKNTVIASADTVAADAVATKALFKMDPKEIQHIIESHKLGLGEMDLAKIKVVQT